MLFTLCASTMPKLVRSFPPRLVRAPANRSRYALRQQARLLPFARSHSTRSWWAGDRWVSCPNGNRSSRFNSPQNTFTGNTHVASSASCAFKVGSDRHELLAADIARICLAMVGRALHAQTRPFPRLPLHRSHQRVQTRPVVCLTRKDPEQAHRPRGIARARGGGVERGGTPKAEAVPQFRNWVRVP